MIWTTILLILIGIGAFMLFAEWAMPYMPIVPLRRTMTERPSDYGLAYEPFDIEADSGLILRGYFIHTLHTEAKATVILLHGIGSCKEVNLGFAKLLALEGYHVVAFDQRAHGQSEGKFCTFGYYEKKDVAKFVDKIEARLPDLPIGIYGASLGGAVAIQALEYDKRLQFGIVESTFNTLENVVTEYGRDYFKFRSRWLVRRVLSKSAVIAGFRPFEIKPVESSRNIEQPILMVHGDADEKIPIDFNRDNFQNLKSADKEFYVVEGAGHNDVGKVGGERYRRKILGFLNRVLKRPLPKVKLPLSIKQLSKKQK